MAAAEIKFLPGVALPLSIYLDSCILIAFLDANHQHHIKSSQFVIQALAVKTKFYLSSLVLDEVWHVLMCCWHQQEVCTKFKSNNKNHIKMYAERIRITTEKILQLFKPTLLPLSKQNTIDTVNMAVELLAEELLAPRDSFHLAYTITSNLDGFVTMDSGFFPLKNTALTLSIVNVQ